MSSAEPITLAGLVDSYLETVVPPDAPEAQIVEVRRAFYAGASAVLAEAFRVVMQPGTEEQVALRFEETLVAWHEEGAAFMELVRTGGDHKLGRSASRTVQ